MNETVFVPDEEPKKKFLKIYWSDVIGLYDVTMLRVKIGINDFLLTCFEIPFSFQSFPEITINEPNE